MEQALAPDDPPEVEPLNTLKPPAALHEPSDAPQETPEDEPKERRETS